MDNQSIENKPLIETRGKIIFFEICKGNSIAIERLGFLPEYYYLMTIVYANDGADLGLQSFQYYGAASTINELVNIYLKNSNSIEFNRKKPYPVRNREGFHELGYEPLDEEEMAEFKLILLFRDIEKYLLSFPF